MANFDKLWVKITLNPYDFTSWTGLLDIADKHEDANKYKEVFDTFLELFPYCYGYWKKYAELEKHKNGRDEALKIYKRGTEAIPLSIDLWIAYLDCFAEANQKEQNFEIEMRSIYDQAIDMVGLEFRSDALWEHYITWETNSNHLILARQLHERLLAIPTQLYFQNWDSFKRLVEDNSLQDLMTPTELAPFHAQIDAKAAKGIEEGIYEGILLPGDDEPEIIPGQPRKFLISVEEEETLKQMIVNAREKVYQASYQQIMKRWFFEEKIRRPYFHVKPLDDAQLANWADYLSFEIAELHRFENLSETQKEQLMGSHAGAKRVTVLFERCLVSCALYEHMWIRYAKYLEDDAKDFDAAFRVYFRAGNIHLRNKPTVHFHWALFMDKHRDMNFNDLVPKKLTPKSQGWPLMTIQGVSKNIGAANDENVLPLSSLDIMTALERRLPNSALVCSRRCDFMRRSGASLTDMMICLRSGINRLRYAASEHYERAYEVRGTSASVSAQRLLILSQQAKVGAAFLACKMARMLFNLVSPATLIPKWKLLLDSSYNPSMGTKPRSLKRILKAENEPETKKLKTDADNGEEEDECKPPVEKIDEETIVFETDLELEVTVLHLPDARTLNETDRENLTGFQAAVLVLKEAFQYDSTNERVLLQWLDVIYQQRPMDLGAFCDVIDRAVISSVIPEESKMSFMQRKLQVLEEFGNDSAMAADAYEDYLRLATSMHNERHRRAAVGGENGGDFQPQMYSVHGYQDMLNLTPSAVALQGKAPTATHAQTPMATFAPMSKPSSSQAMGSLMSGEAFHGYQAEMTVQSMYTGGAYDPMALAQGNVSGLPPPAPATRLMHPPTGDTSSMGAQNEAWRKAAAAVGQHMAQPRIIEHV